MGRFQIFTNAQLDHVSINEIVQSCQHFHNTRHLIQAQRCTTPIKYQHHSGPEPIHTHVKVKLFDIRLESFSKAKSHHRDSHRIRTFGHRSSHFTSITNPRTSDTPLENTNKMSSVHSSQLNQRLLHGRNIPSRHVT